jgi:hypothetical protein
MRQGGMKPKGHNSGVYWMRANAQGGKRKAKTEKPMEINGIVILFLLLLLPFMLVALLIDLMIKIFKKSNT